MNNRPQAIGGRHSFAVPTNSKTPTRPRLTLNAPPSALRQSTSRFSIGAASANKRLSMFKGPTSQIPKDTNDKSYQMRVVKKIHSYIAGLDGEEVISEARIAQPQTKDFIIIFELIYESISRDYEYPKERKLQDELGYPYQIKTSTLQTIGASHSWHYLLHALNWLVDIVQKPDKICVGSQVLLTGDDDNGQVKAYRLSWSASKYHEYCKNRNVLEYNDFIEKATKSVKDFFENNENINGQIKTTEDYLGQVNQEIAEMREQNGNEDKLRDDIRRTEDDIKKTVTYNQDLEVVVGDVIAQKDATEAETKALKIEVDSMKEQVAKKKLEVLEQEKTKNIKGSEAKQIMSEYFELKRRARSCQSSLEELSKEQWKNKPIANEAFVQLFSQARKVISVIKDVGEKVNYTFQRYDETTIKNPRDLHNALLNDLRFEYESIRTAIANLISTTGKDINEIQSDINHIENRAQVESERLAEFESKLQKKVLLVQQYSEEAKSDRKKEQIQIEKLENDKEILQKRLKGVGALQEELKKARHDLEETLANAEQQKEECENKLKDSALTAYDCLKHTRKERQILERTVLSLLKDWQNL